MIRLLCLILAALPAWGQYIGALPFVVSGGGGGGITPIASTGAQAASGFPLTVTTPSSTFNGTGANAIFAAVATVSGVTGTVTDSSGNTYAAVNLPTSPQGAYSNPGEITLYCTFNPTVTSNMTFTYLSGTISAPAMGVLGVAGLGGCSVDQTNGLPEPAGGTSTQPGSITPTQNNEIWIAVCQTTNAVTDAPSSNIGTLVYQAAFSSGIAFSIGMYYGIQTTATAVNPTFSWDITSQNISAIWSFEQ